jgi:hypothetical protein
MPIDYEVKQGDHVAKIAAQFGFGDFGTVWDHPANAALVQSRGNPNVLLPGDVLHIPDKTPKVESRATGQVHQFRKRTMPLLLRLALKGPDGLPLAGENVVLQVEGEKFELTTDDEGRIERRIRPTAESGKVTIRSSRIEAPLAIGHLDPVDVISGWRARLNNLGYGAGPTDDADDPLVRSAVEEFQCDQELPVTGDADDATRAALLSAHGC